MVEGSRGKMNKENKTKVNEYIKLDIATQEDLKELIKTSKEIQARLNIIVNIYVRAKNRTGNYRISKDFTCLEKIKNGD